MAVVVRDMSGNYNFILFSTVILRISRAIPIKDHSFNFFRVPWGPLGFLGVLRVPYGCLGFLKVV